MTSAGGSSEGTRCRRVRELLGRKHEDERYAGIKSQLPTRDASLLSYANSEGARIGVEPCIPPPSA